MKASSAFRLAALSSIALGFASCETMQNSRASTDPYASNYGDGGYNPYPSQPGYGSAGGNVGTYTPPPQSDPYAFTPPTEPTPAPTRSSSSSSSSRSSSSSSSYSSYTVKKGDTLYSLARKNGTSVSKIKSANGLSSDLIRIGQRLKIP